MSLVLVIDRPLSKIATLKYDEATIKRFRINKFEREILEKNETVWRDEVAFFIQEQKEAGA